MQCSFPGSMYCIIRLQLFHSSATTYIMACQSLWPYTGKYLSEALIIASTNPQYDYRLFIHTIRKCQKMAWQNTFKILLLNDANMIGEITNLALLIPCMEFQFFWPNYLHLKCFECAISKLFQKCVSVSSKSRIKVNSGQKVPFLKRTHIWHFHSCFLVFSYQVIII